VRQLLAELARALLPRGMTPKTFGEMAKYAFVEAAAEISTFGNGRINHSRVAAQTGLSRADVRRLLGKTSLDSNPIGNAPVERVINGWRTDREFVSRAGKPKRLQFSGSSGSFSRLVRKYAGDITHRAVLDELRRIGVVRDDGVTVQLLTSPRSTHRNNFSFLAPVLPVFIDALRTASSRTHLGSSAIHRICLPVESEVDLAIVRGQCLSTVSAMLARLEHSLGAQIPIPRGTRSFDYSFAITVLLAETHPRDRARPKPI